MTDNVSITPGTGISVAADDISSVLYQRIKISVGPDGGPVTDVSAAAPLPVTGPVTDTELRASDVAVTLDGEEVAVTGPLTDTELRAADVVVSLDGEEVAVSGPLTDTELRATDVAITLDGEEVAINDGGNSITVDGSVTANPTTFSMTTVTNTTSSSGDNTLVAAPGASTRIVVHELQVQLEASTATTYLVKSGSTTKRRFYAKNEGDGVVWLFPHGKEFRCAENEALVLNLSGANASGYVVRYTTEAT